MKAEKAAYLMLRFIEGFLQRYPAASGYALLSPENISVNQDGIRMFTADPALAKPRFHPGFTAPEVAASGQMTPGGAVYFCGAVLYTMVKGILPPDSADRARQNQLVFSDKSPLIYVVNRAMALRPAERYSSLPVMADGLRRYLQSAAPEYLAAPPPAEAAPTAPAGPAASARSGPKETVFVATVPTERLVATPKPPPPKPAPQAVLPPEDEPAEEKKPPRKARRAPEQGLDGGLDRSLNSGDAAPEPPEPDAATPEAPEQAPRAATGRELYSTRPAKPKKSGRVKALVAVLVVVLVLAGAFFGYSLWQSTRISEGLSAGNWQRVVAAADAAPWLKTARSQPYNYARARLLMEEGDWEGALPLLQGLGSYADSDGLILQTQYRAAESLMNSGKLNEALAAYEALGDYEDSAGVATQLRGYMEALAATDAAAQYKGFAALGAFLDSAEKAEAAAAGVYEYALSLYGAGQFEMAYETFYRLSGYRDADGYAEACNLWRGAAEGYSANEEPFAALMALAGQLDAGPVLMSDRFFGLFLEGQWVREDGETLTVTASGFRFSDQSARRGDWSFGRQSIYNGDDTAATFSYIDADSVEISVSGGEAQLYTRVLEGEAEADED